MSIISVDFSKQHNEIEEFTIYHCNIISIKSDNLSEKKITIMNDNLVRIEILQFSDKLSGKKKVNEYRKQIVEHVNLNSKYYTILFTSVDNNKIYFCIKPKLYISDIDLYTHISDEIKHLIKQY